MSMEHARRRYLRSDRTVGCAKVSSALSRCARYLSKIHTKKHLYIENNNSGPNIYHPAVTNLLHSNFRSD